MLQLMWWRSLRCCFCDGPGEGDRGPAVVSELAGSSQPVTLSAALLEATPSWSPCCPQLLPFCCLPHSKTLLLLSGLT